MLKDIHNLYRLLPEPQRRKLLRLQLLVTVMAILEVLSISLVGPFIALLTSPEEVIEKVTFFEMSTYSLNHIILYSGIFLLILIALSSVLSMYAIWSLTFFGTEVGVVLSNSLYKNYIYSDWSLFSRKTTAEISKEITTECIRVTDQVVLPLLYMNSKIILVFFLVVFVLYLYPILSFISVAVFSILYYFIYILIVLL